jgi:hypothetical protein
MLELVTLDPQGILSAMSAVYNWCHFCLFTGSRLGKYGQSKPPKGAPDDWFATAPHSKDVPAEWHGKPLAFHKEDFTFYTSKRLPYPGMPSLLTPQEQQSYAYITAMTRATATLSSVSTVADMVVTPVPLKQQCQSYTVIVC